MRAPSPIQFKRPRRFVWAAALLAAVFIALFLPVRAGAEKPEQLQPQGYVNDFAGVLDAQAKAQLTALCEEVDHKAGAQIAVVTVKSLEGQQASDFAVNLGQHWGVGPKQQARGVMILLAPAEHKYFTAVGYGLEPILPDGKVGGFGREMVPLLRQNDYGGALLLLTQRIAQVIAADRGVTLATAPAAPERPANPPGKLTQIIGYIGLFGILAIIWFVFSLIRFVFRTLFFGGVRRGHGHGGFWMGPWIGGSSWGGSSGGGFGGGGGGFGGFGGGGFGGGGAGGSW